MNSNLTPKQLNQAASQLQSIQSQSTQFNNLTTLTQALVTQTGFDSSNMQPQDSQKIVNALKKNSDKGSYPFSHVMKLVLDKPNSVHLLRMPHIPMNGTFFPHEKIMTMYMTSLLKQVFSWDVGVIEVHEHSIWKLFVECPSKTVEKKTLKSFFGKNKFQMSHRRRMENGNLTFQLVLNNNVIQPISQMALQNTLMNSSSSNPNQGLSLTTPSVLRKKPTLTSANNHPQMQNSRSRHKKPQTQATETPNRGQNGMPQFGILESPKLQPLFKMRNMFHRIKFWKGNSTQRNSTGPVRPQPNPPQTTSVEKSLSRPSPRSEEKFRSFLLKQQTQPPNFSPISGSRQRTRRSIAKPPSTQLVVRTPSSNTTSFHVHVPLLNVLHNNSKPLREHIAPNYHDPRMLAINLDVAQALVSTVSPNQSDTQQQMLNLFGKANNGSPQHQRKTDHVVKTWLSTFAPVVQLLIRKLLPLLIICYLVFIVIKDTNELEAWTRTHVNRESSIISAVRQEWTDIYQMMKNSSLPVFLSTMAKIIGLFTHQDLLQTMKTNELQIAEINPLTEISQPQKIFKVRPSVPIQQSTVSESNKALAAFWEQTPEQFMRSKNSRGNVLDTRLPKTTPKQTQSKKNKYHSAPLSSLSTPIRLPDNVVSRAQFHGQSPQAIQQQNMQISSQFRAMLGPKSKKIPTSNSHYPGSEPGPSTRSEIQQTWFSAGDNVHSLSFDVENSVLIHTVTHLGKLIVAAAAGLQAVRAMR